ncbi:hypothetical protein [Rhizobium leguminosarum]|uniref:hypothetical protein n=1 Tax=Rhizobium leguminosarum TaxID=384 RepID=UPI0013EEFC42|nr:hypothetical protein [Rhizobium leguminosarum]
MLFRNAVGSPAPADVDRDGRTIETICIRPRQVDEETAFPDRSVVWTQTNELGQLF